MIVRLSDTQARVIREAKHHYVNGGPVTMRVHYFRGVRSATFAKLYRLGLITASHEYADLTDIGVSAWVTLSSDTTVRTVVGGDSCGGAAAVIEQPKPAPAERNDVVYASREASDALMARIRKLATADSEVAAWAKAGRIQRTNADAGSKAKFIECIAALWPKGTRVRGLDTDGVRRTGTVNGLDVSYVISTDHPNFGRAYVGVNWDEIPGQWTISRNRPFVDTLTGI